MFDYKLARVEKMLSRLYSRGIFKDKKVYLFGVSENTRQIVQILRTYQIEPEAVLDNDKIKQGTYCSGIPVGPVEAVRDAENQQNMYIVCSLYWREMTAQLRDIGIKNKNIFMMYEEETLSECIYQAVRGKRIYERLTARYGKLPVFLCPYTGTGDIYLIGTFWKQYTEKVNIRDYVFIVISKACEKAARLFGIKNIVRLENKVESSYLIRYYMLCPEKGKITILNDSWGEIHTNPLEWFRGYKGLEFMQIFRKFVFDLPDHVQPRHPVFENKDSEVQEFFREHSLEDKNTVILSPYSNTLADLPDDFWGELAKALKKMGFIVCTNSSGETEPAVEGTIPVFFSLDMAPQIVGRAGYFIGIRSGFCDMISGADAKKIILYHARERFFNGSTYEYFNLKDMGLCDDAIEIQFDKSDEELFEKVIDVMKHERR
jgi:hypothetical protein